MSVILRLGLQVLRTWPPTENIREMDKARAEVEQVPQPEYTEGEFATALRNYEAFHRLPFGSATVEQLQSSSAKIGGWLRAGDEEDDPASPAKP